MGVVASVFVGREREMAALDHALDGTFDSQGALFLIGGEPGIGKTRLCRELAAVARGRGMPTYWGRPWEDGGAPPFWPWVQIVRAHIREGDPVTIREDLGPIADHLARIVPELRRDFWDPAIEPASDPERARFDFFESMARFLRAASARRPTLVVLDDVHWADVPSLLLVKFLARELVDARILLVATYRDFEASALPELAQLLAELGREATTLPLAGLSPADVRRLVTAVHGVAPTAAVLAALHESSGGNPFFLDGIVRVLAGDGRLERGDWLESARFTIPNGVREAVRRRLTLLTADCRDALMRASVIGRDFDAAILDELDGDGASAAEILAPAVAMGILGRIADVPGRYAFSHTLVRETLYDSQPLARRRELHLLVGEALERLRGSQEGVHLSALAHHFLAAIRPGEVASKAVRYARDAGERALGALAYEKAAFHFESALHALEHAPHGSTERCDLLLALGDAHARSGQTSKSRRAFARAGEIATSNGDGERFAHAALGYAGGLGGLGLRNRADRIVVDMLEKALLGLGEGDGVLRVRCLSRLAVELYFTSQEARRAALARAAVEMADRIRAPVLRVVALYSLHFATLGPSGVEERATAAEEIVRIAQELGDREMEFRGHHFRLHTMLEIGHAAGVDAAIDASVQLAAELRQPIHRWQATLFRAMRALRDGALGEAETLVEEALAIGQEGGVERALEAYGIQKFALSWVLGRLGELEEPTKALAAEFPDLVGWRVALTILYADGGRLNEARAQLDSLARNRFAGVPRDGSWLFSMHLLALSCARLGDSARAAVLYELLLPHAEQHAVVAAGDGSLGSVWTALGALAATLGRVRDAVAHFERAIERNDASGNLPLTLHAMLLCAATLRASGEPRDRTRAGELLAHVLEVSEARGFARFVADVAAIRATDEPPTRAHPTAGSVIRFENDSWTIIFAGRAICLRHSKGLLYLARLMGEPHRDFHVSRLAGGPEDPRRKLDELRAALDDAAQRGDRERAHALRVEIDEFRESVGAAHGVGREKDPEAVERTRKSVCNRLRDAMNRIARVHPELGAHLENSVRMGIVCAYQPERPISWSG